MRRRANARSAEGHRPPQLHKAAKRRGQPTHARVPWTTQARVHAQSARPIDQKDQGHRHCSEVGDGAVQNNPNPISPGLRNTTKVLLECCDGVSIALPKLPSPFDDLIMSSTSRNWTVAHHPMLSIWTIVSAKPAELFVGIPTEGGTGWPLQEHLRF